MSKIKMKTIRGWSSSELLQKIQDARNDLGKLQTDGAKGTLRKESGKIKAQKHNIARMLTRRTELMYEAGEEDTQRKEKGGQQKQ